MEQSYYVAFQSTFDGAQHERTQQRQLDPEAMELWHQVSHGAFNEFQEANWPFNGVMSDRELQQTLMNARRAWQSSQELVFLMDAFFPETTDEERMMLSSASTGSQPLRVQAPVQVPVRQPPTSYNQQSTGARVLPRSLPRSRGNRNQSQTHDSRNQGARLPSSRSQMSQGSQGSRGSRIPIQRINQSRQLPPPHQPNFQAPPPPPPPLQQGQPLGRIPRSSQPVGYDGRDVRQGNVTVHRHPSQMFSGGEERSQSAPQITRHTIATVTLRPTQRPVQRNQQPQQDQQWWQQTMGRPSANHDYHQHDMSEFEQDWDESEFGTSPPQPPQPQQPVSWEIPPPSQSYRRAISGGRSEFGYSEYESEW